MSKQGPSGEVPVNVEASGQGIQVGDGGTLINHWGPRQPLDPSYLSELNPLTAVALLQQRPHDEVREFFARATDNQLSEIFPVFLELDEARVIATLAEINERKASRLIETCCVEAALVALPAAAKAVDRKAASLRWTDAGPLERFSGGYARRYKNGRIFWDDRAGVHVTVGVIDDYSTARGSSWGVPIGDQEPAPVSPFGTEGIRQGFLLGTVYSSKHGIYCVMQELCYAEEGCSYGWLGFPIGEIRQNHGIGNVQPFEGGFIYSGVGEDQSAFAVRRDVVDALSSNWIIRPLSKETITTSSYGTTGGVQGFECTDWDTFMAVASSPEGHDVVPVAGEILRYYAELGGEKSSLGFPVSPVAWMSERVSVQSFEGGMIYLVSGIGPIVVSDTLAMCVPDNCLPHELLGIPVSEEQFIGPDESDCIQFFENGVITLRDGRAEMWVRPQSDLAPVIYVDHRVSEPDFLSNIPSEPEDDGFVAD
jgi:uncharacterized protein with LGFP repeats